MRPPAAPRRPAPGTREPDPGRTPAASGDPDPRPPAAGRPARVVGPARTATAPARAGRTVDDDETRGVRVSQIADRLAERRTASRRRTWHRLAVLAGVVAVLAGLGWLVLVSPVLALRTSAVDVAGGGEYLDPASVDAVVAPSEGTPLARVDAAAIAAEIEALPAVREAEVTRAWPNGLRVEITPRTPVAVVPGDAGTLLLDDEGVVVATVAPDAVPVGLPEMTVPLDEDARADSVAAVLAVLGTLPDELRTQIVTAGARSAESVRFELADGSRVEWGSAAQSELKAAVLATLLQVGASYYDVSAPEAPITQ